MIDISIILETFGLLAKPEISTHAPRKDNVQSTGRELTSTHRCLWTFQFFFVN